eukprot:1145823-Pelagomonas_calceolata.AAC.10
MELMHSKLARCTLISYNNEMYLGRVSILRLDGTNGKTQCTPVVARAYCRNLPPQALAMLIDISRHAPWTCSMVVNYVRTSPTCTSQSRIFEGPKKGQGFQWISPCLRKKRRTTLSKPGHVQKGKAKHSERLGSTAQTKRKSKRKALPNLSTFPFRAISKFCGFRSRWMTLRAIGN